MYVSAKNGKHKITLFVVLFIISSLQVFSNDKNNFVANQLYIKFNPSSEITKTWFQNGRKGAIPRLNSYLGKHSTMPFVRDEILRGFTNHIAPKINNTTLQDLDNSINSLQLIALVKFESDEEYSENSLIFLAEKISKLPFVEYAEPVPAIYFSAYPEDELAKEQYALELTKAIDAWDLLKPSRPIIVSIVDTGIDTAHVDLAENIWKNEGETGIDENGNPKESNGIDDDNNGFVDDYYGWDFFYDDNSATYVHPHGTHVAGIVGAVHNTIGVAGLAKNVKLMSIKIGTDSVTNNICNGGEAILYSVMMGADVVNCSWGGPKASYAEIEAIKLAAKHAVVVCAAGNSFQKMELFPGYTKGTLSVASVGNDDVRSRFSTYGTKIGISAPGSKILSTYPVNKYTKISGTSMAAPTVSAAAAMVKNNFPHYTPEQIIARLKATADNIDEQNPNCSNYLGTGRVNMYRALAETNCKYLETDNIKINDNTTFNFDSGEKLAITADVKNLLNSVTGVYVRLRASYINFENDSLYIANFIDSNSVLTQALTVNAEVQKNAPQDTIDEIFIYFYDDTDKLIGRDIITLEIAPSWKILNYNNISCVYTPNGGFSKPNFLYTGDANNFSYKNYHNLLHITGLVMGNNQFHALRNINLNDDPVKYEKSFSSYVKTDEIIEIENKDKCWKAAKTSYSGHIADATGELQKEPQVQVTQTLFESTKEGLDNSLFIVYEVKNISNKNINDFYLSACFDWDISVADFNNIMLDENKIAWAYYSLNDTTPKINAKLLSQQTPTFAKLIMLDPNGKLKSQVNWSDLTQHANAYVPPFELDMDIAMAIGGGGIDLPVDSTEKFVFVISVNENKNIADNQIDKAEKFYTETHLYLDDNSIKTNSCINTFKVFPNPAKDFIYYEINGIPDGKYQVKIVDLTGKTIAIMDSELYFLETEINKGNIKLPQLLEGTYYLVIENNSMKYATKFIIAS